MVQPNMSLKVLTVSSKTPKLRWILMSDSVGTDPVVVTCSLRKTVWCRYLASTIFKMMEARRV
jgi:hypothetical protein